MANSIQQAAEIAQKICNQYGTELVSEKEQEVLQGLKILANTFIQRVNNIINQNLTEIKERETLKERIQRIGTFMHESSTNTRSLLNEGHIFQEAFNTFIGRIVNLAYVTEDGKILVQTDLDAKKIYQQMTATKSGHVGKLINARGVVGASTFQSLTKLEQELDLQKLQQQINKAINGRQIVYTTAMNRYQKKMDYKTRVDKKGNTVKNKHSIYWHLFNPPDDPEEIGWKAVSKGGYIGQGYVDMVLNSKNFNSALERFAPFTRHPYNKIFENQIEDLANRAANADSLAGILQGDVILSNNGNIQLAVKQGFIFNAASIAPMLGLAYAIQQTDNYSILKNIRTIIQTQFDEKTISKTGWEEIFIALTNKAVNETFIEGKTGIILNVL